MIRGTTRNIYFGGPVDKNSDPTDVIIPSSVDKRNGVTTDAGSWHRRPGFAEKWDLGVSSPVDLLIPEYGGFAATLDKKIYRLGETPQVMTGAMLNGSFRPTFAWYQSVSAASPLCIICDGGPVLKITTQPFGLGLLGGSPVHARFVDTIDTRVVLAGHDDLNFVWSDLEKPESYPAANFDRVSGDGETLLFFKIFERKLFFFKSKSLEIWVNLGVRFGRQNAFEKGCGAPYGVVQANGTFYWYGDDNDFYGLGASGATVISGRYTEELRRAGTMGDLYGFDFRAEKVVRWFSPSTDRSFVYDYAHGIFSEDGQWIDGTWRRMPIRSYMEQGVNAYIGDYEPTGRIYHWSREHFDDNGVPIRCYRRFTVPMSDNGSDARANRLRFRVKRGSEETDLLTPRAAVAWRIDKGERQTEDIDLGGVGEHDPYVDVWNLGVGRELDMEITESENSDSLITHAYLTAEQLGA